MAAFVLITISNKYFETGLRKFVWKQITSVPTRCVLTNFMCREFETW
jgi:hypothetical protein